MLLFLLGSAFSVDRTKYRQCKDSPFCVRNRFVKEQRWETNIDEGITTNGTFILPVLDGMYKNVLNLSVSFLPSNLVRVRVVPSAPEPFKRYDCAKEPTIVNQSVANDRRDFTVERNTSHAVLRSGDTEVVVHAAPFRVDVVENGVTKATLNPDDSGVFETNLDKEEFPEHWEVADFGRYRETLRDGPAAVAMTVKFYGKRTRFVGLPSHTLNLSLPATVEDGAPLTDPIRLYNTDINSFEVGSVMSMYGSIPYLIGHDGRASTSLLWCNPSETWVDIDNERLTARFVSETGLIDVFVTSGAHADVLRSYTDLTGRPAMPQLFALGYHQCRWTYYSEKELREVSAALDKAEIPHDAMWMDLDHTDGHRYFTFNKDYSNVEKMVDDFMKVKRRVVAQVDPHLKVESTYRVFSDAKQRGYLVKARDGNDYHGHCWPGNSGWVDFLNPEARNWWAQQYRFDIYKGSSRYLFTWNDMNEPAVFDVPDMSLPRDTQHINGYEDRSVHNVYGHLMVSSSYKGQVLRNSDKNERPFVLTRSLFAGSQKYAFMWTGDNTATWDQLRNSIAEVLSLGVSGFPFAGADVGGFFNSPDNELLTRWYQVGAFCYPFFRCHCHHLSARREPYRLPGAYLEAARTAIVERYQLLPLWYTASRISHETGAPVVRPLWWEFDDAEARDMERELMIGDTLLVAPVLDQGCTTHPLFLPRNSRWYDFRTLAEVSERGARSIALDGPICNTPAFIRGGTTLAVKPIKRKSADLMEKDPFNLIVALDENRRAQGRLYIDDGHTFGFERGEYIDKVFEFDGERLSSRDLNNKSSQSEFAKTYSAKVQQIEVIGLDARPTKVTNSAGKAIDYEWKNGILRIKRVNYGVKDNWELHVYTAVGSV